MQGKWLWWCKQGLSVVRQRATPAMKQGFHLTSTPNVLGTGFEVWHDAVARWQRSVTLTKATTCQRLLCVTDQRGNRLCARRSQPRHHHKDCSFFTQVLTAGHYLGVRMSRGLSGEISELLLTLSTPEINQVAGLCITTLVASYCPLLISSSSAEMDSLLVASWPSSVARPARHWAA